jgi:hypothetical protein
VALLQAFGSPLAYISGGGNGTGTDSTNDTGTTGTTGR